MSKHRPYIKPFGSHFATASQIEIEFRIYDSILKFSVRKVWRGVKLEVR